MKKSSIIITIVVSVVVVAAIAVSAIIFVPRVVHTCDDCGETFFGTGYRPNIISNVLTDDQIICENCAAKQHAIEIALGYDLDGFKRGLFD